MAKAKARNFAFILYPESLPKDWEEKLETLDIPMAISPIHDKDVREDINPFELSDEEMALYDAGKLYKKPHYHVMYCAPNPVTVDGVRNRIKRKLGDNTISHVEIVDGVESYYKYLTHESKDAIKKKKTKYDKKDLIHLNGFDIDRYIVLDESQKREMFNGITKAIRKYKLANIFDLSDYIEKHGEEIGIESLNVMNDIISTRTGLLRMYFDGAYQTRARELEKPSPAQRVEKAREKIAEDDWNEKLSKAKEPSGIDLIGLTMRIQEANKDKTSEEIKSLIQAEYEKLKKEHDDNHVPF